MARKIKKKWGIRLIVCSGLLTTAVVLSAWLVPMLPLRDGEGPGVEHMPDFEVPTGEEYFFVYGTRAELSQSVLYHDLGQSISNAKKADVLFIGDSRLQLGLRGEFLLPTAQELGLRLFSLGMGHVEGVKFALDLIRRHDLKPKVAVVVGGPHIFSGDYSEMGLQAKRMSRWGAIKNQMEEVLWWNLQFRLHRVVPKLNVFVDRFQPGYIEYRSSQTGWYKVALEWTEAYEVRPGADDQDYERFLPLAQELKEELDSRGSLMVLSVVPYGLFSPNHLPYLSSRLNVPIAYPRVDDLRLADGSHLNLESARRFSIAFWDEFIALPEVREKLSLPAK